MNVLASNARIPSTARIMLNVHTTVGPKIMSTDDSGELEFFCPILSLNQVKFVGEHVSVGPVEGGMVLKLCCTVSSTQVRFEVIAAVFFLLLFFFLGVPTESVCY